MAQPEPHGEMLGIRVFPLRLLAIVLFVCFCIRQIPLSESSVDDNAEELLHLSPEDLPLDEPLAAEKYREITRDEVRAAFRKWIRPHDFVQVVEGPVPH